jgi:hypothetical protein
MSAAQINASMGWNPAAQASATNIYGPQGFGGQTAQYAAAGAAYGRQVPLSPAAMNSSQADRIRQIYGAGALGGIGSDAARSPNQGRMSGMFDQSAYAPAVNPYAQQYRMPNSNPEYFNPSTYSGSQGNYGIPYNGSALPGDIGFSRQPSYPNLGYNPGMANQFANPGMNANPFQNRFGLGFPGQGTPSQYAPGAQMPPGFSRPYSIDNPGGALPLNPPTPSS